MKLFSALLLGVLFSLAASAAAPFVFGGTDVLRNVLAFPAAGAVAIVCAVMAGWTAKALKFRLLVAQLGPRLSFVQCLAVSIGCDGAFVASPGGVAGYPATVLLFGKVGVDASRALTVAAADQVLDLGFFGIAMPLALVWALIHDLPTGPIVGKCTVAAVASGVMLVAITSAIPGRQSLWKLVQQWPRTRLTNLRHIESVRGHWQQVRCHLQSLRTAPAAVIACTVLATAAQWLARYATLGIALAWMGYGIPSATVFFAQAAALHAGQWTGAPGGAGATDTILFESLRHWVPFTPLATALIVWRLATFHLTLLAGSIACTWLIVRSRPARADYCCRGDVQN